MMYSSKSLSQNKICVVTRTESGDRISYVGMKAITRGNNDKNGRGKYTVSQFSKFGIFFVVRNPKLETVNRQSSSPSARLGPVYSLQCEASGGIGRRVV